MNQKGNADDNDNNKGNDYVMKVWCLWTESDKKSNHKINESDKTVWRGPDSLK